MATDGMLTDNPSGDYREEINGHRLRPRREQLQCLVDRAPVAMMITQAVVTAGARDAGDAARGTAVVAAAVVCIPRRRDPNNVPTVGPLAHPRAAVTVRACSRIIAERG
jgi:hypothetical protein